MTKKRKNEPLDPEVKPELDPEIPAAQPGAQQDIEGAPPVQGKTADGDDVAGSLVQEIENMALGLDNKTKEAAEANEKYLRTYADFENYRKRMQRDQVEFRKYANEQLALELLTVVDHLGLAIKHASEASGSGEGLQQGVEMVYKQFRDVLEKFSIAPFKAAGEMFDPAMHEAMMQVETADAPENTVVQVFQEGYRYHDKVLRHAKVGVSKRPSGAGQAASAQQEAQTTTDDGEDPDD
jgi:molecular chaperone GrpE